MQLAPTPPLPGCVLQQTFWLAQSPEQQSELLEHFAPVGPLPWQPPELLLPPFPPLPPLPLPPPLPRCTVTDGLQAANAAASEIPMT